MVMVAAVDAKELTVGKIKVLTGREIEELFYLKMRMTMNGNKIYRHGAHLG